MCNDSYDDSNDSYDDSNDTMAHVREQLLTTVNTYAPLTYSTTVYECGEEQNEIIEFHNYALHGN